jgi:7-cyano-7-deazaguanine synthase
VTASDGGPPPHEADGPPAGDLVLLSGGLDSTVCLALACGDAGRQRSPSPVALTFDYGQRHRVELDRAAKVAAALGCEQLVVRLDASRWGGSALTDPTVAVPPPAIGAPTVPVTYVPARNLVFLSVAVAIAEARHLRRVHIGVNALDYSGYPDCRPEFLSAFAEAARLGTRRGTEGDPVELWAPLVALSKEAIVRAGIGAGAPLELTWSCYRGGNRPCGDCDACVLRAAGFAAAGVDDPALRP